MWSRRPTRQAKAAALKNSRKKYGRDSRRVSIPEIPVNIVDLGLIYGMKVAPIPEGGNRVDIQMTLTAQGCGMGPSIAADAKHKIEEIPEVADADVQVVWDPPWSPDKMSPEAKSTLGIG